MDFNQALNQSGGFRVKDATKTTKAVSATGGLNLEDAPLEIPAGELVGCLNYEPSIISGYRRVQGYERFDGHSSPTDTPYGSLQFTSTGGFNPSIGTVMTESGSGAQGVVVAVDTINSAVVYIGIAGAPINFFVGNGSTLTAGGQTATSVLNPLYNQGATPALTDAYYYSKWIYLQSFITPVGGSLCSGPVLGVWAHGAYIYAFRNSADGTQALFFVASATGWTQINLGYKILFTNGIYSSSMQPPPEGTVLTGATSGATFTIRRVGSLTGTWGTDAGGYFITNAITGTPVANELLQSGGVTYATFNLLSPQVLAPGGQYYFRSYNFNASQTPSTGYRIYGVSGVDRGFEYSPADGVFVKITTTTLSSGYADTPTHLEIHADYLFYSFPGGSLQNSGFQLPLNWNPVFGADERSVENNVTFLREDVSQTLYIGTRQRIWSLTGLQVEQFQIRVYSSNNGAIPNTDEMPGQIIFGEDRGITSIAASAQYGDFEASSLTNKILTLISNSLYSGPLSDSPIGAIVTRSKNLYRLIFASGTVYHLAINAQGQFTGWTLAQYVHTPSCASANLFGGNASNYYERSFMGCADGYVRELDKGISFDGQVVNHFLKFAYYHLGSPDYLKRIRRVQIDIKAEGPATINIGCDCNYGNLSGQLAPQKTLGAGGGFWDVANWAGFTWGAPSYQPVVVKLDLEGYNVSLAISGGGLNDYPFTVSGLTYQYTPRIINRNTPEA
jgi:hypothetical protein